jgi:integrase
VRYIRASAASNRALARELGVSDVLISKVPRRVLWDVEPDARGRNEIPRLAVCATLALAGLRNRELCLLDGEHMDFRRRSQTPHTLRRTFASILAECNVPPRRAMYLLGHTDATLTMAVYQQVLDLGGAGIKTLERLLGARLDEVGQILCGRQPEAEWSPGPRKHSTEVF